MVRSEISRSGHYIFSMAIANSSKLVTLDEQIALIDKRLEVAQERIEHTSKKRWTNYLSTDPLRIAANLLGGGDDHKSSKYLSDGDGITSAPFSHFPQ
ncbi:hypothetical protein IQ238_06135 [Pleurocapsales cyanobacterium LEGE 06147]|nr:hypothetical protein [Pleurocapsales cyanobacterium LEGE 06147]